MNLVRACAVALAAAATSMPAAAATFGTNLVVNGDAETGDLTGWSITGVVATTNTAPTAPFGSFSFWSGTGGTSETLVQGIDLAPLAAEIASGGVGYTVSAQLQSRRAGQSLDRVVAQLVFRDAANTVIGVGAPLEDPTNDVNDFSWDFESTSGFVPTGATTAEIDLVFTRDAGTSTDAYADDISLVLTPAAVPLPAALPLLAAGLCGFAMIRRRSTG